MRRSRLLWGLVLFGLLCSLASLASRVALERSVKGTDLVIDYNGLMDLCQTEGIPPEQALQSLKQAGVTAVAYPEMMLDRLVGSGQVTAYSSAEMRRAIRHHDVRPMRMSTAVFPERTYLLVNDPRLLDDLQAYLSLYLAPGRVIVRARPKDGSAGVLEVLASQHILSDSGMGFSSRAVALAQRAGLGVWLRPENRPRFQDADVQKYFQLMETLHPRGVIFEGTTNEVVGYPNSLKVMVAALRADHLLFGDIEAPTVAAAQKGSFTIGRDLPEQTVRVLSIPVLQQMRMTMDDVVDRYRLGGRERNMRVLYLRFFASAAPQESVFQTNLDFVAAVRHSLETANPIFTMLVRNLVFTGAQPFPLIVPNPLLLVGMTLGAAAAGVLFLELFLAVPLKALWGIVIGLPVLAILSIIAHRWYLVSTGMALEAAFVFSVLGLSRGLPLLMRDLEAAPSARSALARSASGLLLVTLVSLVGGVYMAGLMSGTTFMLSVYMFRGIKLIMVAGPLIVLFLYVTRWAERPRTVEELLNLRVVLWHVLVGLAMLAVGVFYIIRTGNAPAGAASHLEIALRNLLENVLTVRPRFKEFALGHPAWMILGVVLWKRRFKDFTWLLVLAVAVGQVDVIDTFAHAHTPYLISLVRALLGLFFGLLAGWGVGEVLARLLGEGEEDDEANYDPVAD